MLPDQVNEIHRKMVINDARIKEIGDTAVRVEIVLDILNKAMDKVTTAIDDRNEKISKRVGALENWRNWTTGIAVAVISILGLFKGAIVNLLKGVP